MKLFYSWILFCCLVLCSGPAFSQPKNPSAKFSFNNGNAQDEVSAKKAKLVGANFTDDRFGNSKSAVFLSGHEFSYINLGTYSALKPKSGSISLWVNLTRETFHGQGYKHNPIILTKIAPRDDFFEAYAIYFDLENRKIVATCSNDSSSSPNVYQMEKFSFQTWHHLVITYDNHYLSFYIDGKQIGKAPKNFETGFDPLDSVMVGGSANKKNNRYSFGAFDDIQIYNTVLGDADVLALYNAPNPNKNQILLNWFLLAVSITGGITAIYFFARYRFRLVLKREKQHLELANKLLENDLRINRALMNPHFVFNALNTLHSYILVKNTDVASDYLVKFSRLIRKILDSNMADTLSLEMEVELITRYLEIEELRFKDKIRYEVTVQDLIPSAVSIPIMMVQPFVENAIWHGLLDKEGEKIITVSFSQFETAYIKCVIEDNGTGRKVIRNDTGKKSLATGFVQQRLDLLNRIHNLSCDLEIVDKPGGSGTRVVLLMPILNR
jgi:two-component sensor histidine kinase